MKCHLIKNKFTRSYTKIRIAFGPLIYIHYIIHILNEIVILIGYFN